MSKIRVYELAKELGVDNKAVVALAQQLGFVAKASHSSSLDGGDADQIRRALIRQAVGQTSSEIVKKKVDRVTGETNTVVERRTGNIIRRRKSADAAESAPAQVEAAPSSADDIFQETGSRGTGHEAEAESVTSTNGHGSADAGGQTLGGAALDDMAAEPDAADDTAVSEVPEAAAPADDTKKAGPRVLGRIELPSKKPVVAPKPQPTRRTFGSAAPAIVPVDDSEDEDSKAKSSKKKSKRIEISRIDLVDYEGRTQRRTGRPKPGQRDRARQTGQSADAQPIKAGKKSVKIDEAIQVGALAQQMGLKVGEVIAKLMELGVMATINQVVDHETASLIAEELGFEVESVVYDESTMLAGEADQTEAELLPRPPVITVMGHVDHGKTSLLDKIRSASVAAKEHGGITQHIGAYQVVLPDQRQLTFIDTPGHAAFTQMRARGAQVTDMVVLVVAADDGVMPQTIEALNHAKSAKVPVVVAINKIDKPGSNLERVKQELAQHGLQPESWGGDTMFFHVSALRGDGIPELLEGLLLQAEVKELRAAPSRRARGTIIESKQVVGRGTVATVLVQDGLLRIGDTFVSGSENGRVRSLTDYMGGRLESAGPSTPVEITGLSGVPSAGDDFFVVGSEAKAREVSAYRMEKRLAKERLSRASGPISLEEFAKRANSLTLPELNVIVKADVQGSQEAVREALNKLSGDRVSVKVVHDAIGGITDSDIQLAIASKAIVIGFNVRAEPKTMQEAEGLGVEVRFYRIIYELIDDVKQAMAGLLPPDREEVSLGRAEVREIFTVPKVGVIAGSYVTDGLIRRGALARLLRDSRVIHEGKLGSLRRFKDDAREVQTGYECGIGIDGFNDVKVGDVIEAYEIKETAATLE